MAKQRIGDVKTGELNKVKKFACKDISSVCGVNGFYTKNLIYKEYLISKLKEFPEQIIQIP